VVRLLGWGRLALGIGLVAAPGPAARLWFGDDSAAARLLLRSIGARDLALGGGLLSADDLRPWLVGGIVADLVDCLGSARAAGEVPAAKILPGSALALAFAAAGVVEARRAPRRTAAR
jgi:hypothetical protein